MSINTVDLLATADEIRTLIGAKSGLEGNAVQRDLFQWAHWTSQKFETAEDACDAWKADHRWKHIYQEGTIKIPFPYVHIFYNVADLGFSPDWSGRLSMHETCMALKRSLAILGFEPDLGCSLTIVADQDLDDPFPSYSQLTCYATHIDSDDYSIKIGGVKYDEHSAYLIGQTPYGVDYAWAATGAIAKILQA